jgi:signal transduction histidine kinase
MSSAFSYSGLECVGDISWGSHFCQFYKTRDDLVETLVPYFKAGLENHEQCLWVTAKPLKACDARNALKNAVPNLKEREKSGQIKIIDSSEWYTRKGAIEAPTVIKGWIGIQEQALQKGYTGLRATGNTFWLERKDWEPFSDYESKVTSAFAGHRIIALCSYCMEKCHSEGMLDVIQNHEFAVVRRHGNWHVIENASLKLAKAELRKSNEELEDRVMKRTAELEQMVQIRDEFLSVASHELKTPIASLKLYLDGILRLNHKKSISPEELHQRLKKADTQCGRLDGLVTSLLDISRAGSTQLPVRLDLLDYVEVIREVTERYAASAERADCQLKVILPQSLIGFCDRLRLDQVLTNLISNAIKYAPGAEIEVRAIENEGRCILSVKDTGPGIDKAHQEQVFEKFAQVSRQESAGGFGLGLWIVKQIVLALEGKIQLSSEIGNGSLFTIEIPMARDLRSTEECQNLKAS